MTTYRHSDCAEIDQADQHGWTAMHVAAWQGYPTLVRTLLESQAQVNVYDNAHLTPLHLAAMAGHRDCVEV